MHQMLTALLVVTLTLALGNDVSASDSTHWDYSGQLDPAHWAQQYASCGGSSQSPIDIKPEKATAMNSLPLYVGNYDTTDKLLDIINNGHTVLMKLPKDYPVNRIPYIKDGGLPNQFTFAQLHFHWGSDGTRGSEHTVSGQMYPMELHFVHYNKKYGTFENATKHPDGLAVLGVFVQIAGKDNPAFKPIAEILPKVIEDGHEEEFKSTMSLKDLLPVSLMKFYRYSGSLTTPGCNEIVTWTVLDTPITISEQQLSKFRELKTESGPMVNNYRPVQPLGSRTLYVQSSADYNIPLMALIIPTALMNLSVY